MAKPLFVCLSLYNNQIMRIEKHPGNHKQLRGTLILISICLFSGLYSRATAPSIGITTFNSLTAGALLGVTPSPGTSLNVGSLGWDFTISSPGGSVSMSISAAGADPGGANDFCIRMNRSTAGDFIQYASAKSDDGSAFSLQYAYIKINLFAGSSADMTITGYKGGVAVTGATKTITGILTNPVWTQFDVHTIAAFGDVDEFRFTQAASSSAEISFVELDQFDIAPAIPLPLTLLDFSGLLTGHNVHLEWSTATEQNTSYFEVQRSADGSVFLPVGKVAAAGNSTATLQYTYTDILPSDAPPAVFYRLQMTDLDGQFTYSPIVKITPPPATLTILATPNPFQQGLTINIGSITADNAVITITDMGGRNVLTETIPIQKGSNVITLKTLSQLDKGIYLLHISTRSDKQTIELLKNQ
jgi:type IX secretion system substrate protein